MLQYYSQFLFLWLPIGIHTRQLPFSSKKSMTENTSQQKAKKYFLTVNLFASAMTTCMHPEFSMKHSKPGTKNQITIKHMQNFFHSWPNKNKIVSVISQHPKHQVSARPWFMALYTTKFKNLSTKWDPYTSVFLMSNQSMIKTVLGTSLH